MANALHALTGMAGLLALAWAASENRRGIPWRAVLVGLGLLVLGAALFLKVPLIKDTFIRLNDVLLVLDATVGQNGLVQAREFMAASGANGIVLTKLDGTAKGGVAVAIAQELKVPIQYVGVGEAIDDLIPFDANAYVDALFVEKW